MLSARVAQTVPAVVLRHRVDRDDEEQQEKFLQQPGACGRTLETRGLGVGGGEGEGEVGARTMPSTWKLK